MAQRTFPVVQTAGLCKTFRDFWMRPRVEAVKDLNLQIRPGEIFGLLGPNGSGKTTAIKMLLGLLYPTSGSVFGKSPTDVSVKSRIGFLPEESYLYRYLVASETLDYFGRLFRLPGRVRHERTERLLDMVGLKHEARRPVGEYSKGMARRIGLAQALINDPEFLILDEPTSGLDPIGARQIKDVIRELGRKGKTILLSSHVLADVEDVCDRVIILYGGREMASGNIGELLAEEHRTQVTLPAVSDKTLQRIREVVESEEHASVIDVTHPRQKLESFFLQIVEQAQKKNIQTYGARAAGAVPEFLQKATEETTEEVVGSLVEAAAAPPPVAPAPMPERREVIDELLGTEAVEEPEPEEEAAKGSESSQPTPEETRSQRSVEADVEVIDSLLGDGGHGMDASDDSEEEAPK